MPGQKMVGEGDQPKLNASGQPLNGKNYWLKGGVCAQLAPGYGPRMTVMRVIVYKRRNADGEIKTFVEGARCSYIDPFDGQERQETFRCNLLQPC